MIEGIEKIVDLFGYWPVFADSRIVSFSFCSDSSIELELYYIDSDKSIEGLFSLTFLETSEVELNSIKSENVVDELIITGQSPHDVFIQACYGLSGSFKCGKVQIAKIGT